MHIVLWAHIFTGYLVKFWLHIYNLAANSLKYKKKKCNLNLLEIYGESHFSPCKISTFGKDHC